MDVTGPTEEQPFDPTEEHPFLEHQYTALRTEIEQASERAFKIFAASVLVVPTGLTLGGAVSEDELPLIKMLLPLVLLAFYAMYCAQIFSTRRTGLYIESHIEPILLVRTRGWESWLSDRRYAYDAQMNVAFFLLSAVYYLGTAYIAATADSIGFLDFADPHKAILPRQLEPSSTLMLFILYALAGLAMFFLVQLIPDRQLKEEKRIKQIFRSKRVECTPEELQDLFLKKLKKVKPQKEGRLFPKVRAFFRTFFRAFFGRGHITRDDHHTETSRYVSKPQHIRLTISEGLKKNTVGTVVGLATMLGLLLWAVMPIQRFYHELFPLPDTFAMIFTILSLGVLLVPLVILYYRLVGKNIGAKIDIRFRPAKQPDKQSAESHWARIIAQTSEPAAFKDKKDKTYEWLREMLKEELKEMPQKKGITKKHLKEQWDLREDGENSGHQ